MPIGFYTDNEISKRVIGAFSKSGIESRHINKFCVPENGRNETTRPIFYGILRGTGSAMIKCWSAGYDFWYLDNGYFDAIYMDKQKIKDMGGKYRVVKSDMIEACNIDPCKTLVGRPRVLFLPPSPYTAFMYDTTPEDWNRDWAKKASSLGIAYSIRKKETDSTLEENLEHFDAVLAFNSIGVMKAIEMGKAVYTTHGVVRNSHLFGLSVPYYDLQEMKNYYEPKQFTLDEISSMGVKCLN